MEGRSGRLAIPPLTLILPGDGDGFLYLDPISGPKGALHFTDLQTRWSLFARIVS